MGAPTKPAREQMLAKIRGHSEELASRLESHPLATIALVLDTLAEHVKHGHNPDSLAWTIRNGLADKKFTRKNLPKIILTMHEHARHGYNAIDLETAIERALESKALDDQNLRPVLGEALEHAKQGADATAITTFLAQRPDKLGEARAARKHLLKAAEFLHGVESVEDHGRVSVPLFAYVLETHERKIPEIGEKYWQHVGLYAKQLKAVRTSIKAAA